MGVVINDRSREVLAKINALTTVNLTEFVETVVEVAKATHEKKRSSEATGNLGDSIANDRTDQGLFRVFTQTNYGGYVELGTARMAAQPFIAPGIDVAVREFDDLGLWG